MIRSKTMIVIIIVLIVVVVIAVPYMFLVSVFEQETPPVAVAKADRDRVYLDENITFSGKESKGYIKVYQWSFSDGNSSILQNPVHAFGNVGWYNVTLKVIDQKGKNASCNLSIGVQRTNISDERDADRLTDFRRGRMTGRGFEIPVGPNNGNPNISFEALLIKPIGSFNIEMMAEWRVDENSGRGEIIYSEDFTSTGQDYSISHEVKPESLPCECSTNESSFRVVIWIKTGTWESSHMSICVNYSLEAMVPPAD